MKATRCFAGRTQVLFRYLHLREKYAKMSPCGDVEGVFIFIRRWFFLKE
jgi:hypothetical protein